MSRPADRVHGIRQKILAGHLPKENCRMTWYGPGTGGVCVACEQPIADDDVEVECDLPTGGHDPSALDYSLWLLSVGATFFLSTLSLHQAPGSLVS